MSRGIAARSGAFSISDVVALKISPPLSLSLSLSHTPGLAMHKPRQSPSSRPAWSGSRGQGANLEAEPW